MHSKSTSYYVSYSIQLKNNETSDRFYIFTMKKVIHLLTNIIIFCTLLSTINGALNLFYPSFFTETNCSDNRSWTIWFNINKSNNSIGSDSEDTSLIISQNPKTMCSIPTGIHAQSINYRTGSWKYGWRWAQTTDIVAFVSFYSIEPIGVDFQVRYCCPKEMLIETTTTATTMPMPLDNLTCGKQKVSLRSNLTSRIFSRTSATIANSWPWVSQLKTKSILLNIYLLI